jgi:predicted phage-related endonuclease
VFPELADKEWNESAHWGQLLEGVVATEFARRKGVRVFEEHVVYQSEDVPCMLATIDRMVYQSNVSERPLGLLEVKTRSAYAAKEWESGVPTKVWWQVQHYLAVTGLHGGWVAVLLGGQKMVDYWVPRDDRAIVDLIGRCVWLWECVLAQVPPDVDGSVASTTRLDATPEEGGEVELPDRAADDISIIVTNRARAKELEAETQAARNRLKEAMGTASYGNIEGERRVTWTTVTSTRLDTKKLRAAGLDLTEFENETSTRVMKVKGE